MQGAVDWAQVRHIAYAVRDWSERHARRSSSFYFHRSDDLGGMCAYASTVLVGCFTHLGVEGAALFANQEHAHVRIRHRIIDITATQFWWPERTRERVEIGSLASLKARYVRDQAAWDAQDIYRTVDDAFDGLNPAAQNGFCVGQYWTTRSAMHRTIAQALQFCAGRGLVTVDEPEEHTAFLAVRRAA